MSATPTRLSAIARGAMEAWCGAWLLAARRTRSRTGRQSFPPGAKAGSTLLELLAVIGIIAVLTGLVIGAGRRASDTGKAARARAELTALSAALESYKAAHGDYPRTDTPARLLQSLIGRRGPDYQPVNARPLIEVARFVTSGALDPFTNDSARLLDPWAQSYRYAYKSQTPWSNPSYVLYSAGPDGSESASLLPGGFPDRAATGNADNLFAN